MTRRLTIVVNGSEVEAEIEPRTHLADFLRDQQFLTGTHIGCEHGVCGACTVLIDGSPARSCITYAAACEGAAVITIEGLKDDRVMAELREEFSRQHALQCGYCTPGMLITARDIVTRLPDPSESRIRTELSGNLCRCTGYVGIVEAVKTVAASQVVRAHRAPVRRGLGPVGAHPPIATQAAPIMSVPPAVSRPLGPALADGDGALTEAQWAAVAGQGIELHQSFNVPFPRFNVWRFFEDLERVATCMPGARLTKQPAPDRAEGEVQVKLGPIIGVFTGYLEVDRDEANYRGVARAAGRDARSASAARCIIAYELNADGDGATLVGISSKLLLSGPLAQFSRSGLVRDIADQLMQTFARNLEARLSGAARASGGTAVLDATEIARVAIRNRAISFFRKFFHRRSSHRGQ
jgi:carbon-monoxide dehydrogenase small subunit